MMRAGPGLDPSDRSALRCRPRLAGHAGVCEIVLDRPEALNATDTAMATRLAQACAELPRQATGPPLWRALIYVTCTG